MTAISNKLNNDVVEVEMNAPISHYVLYDFFDEEYCISNNNDNNILLSTKDKSIFITSDRIILNFNYLSNLEREGYIINSHYTVNVKAIPKKYRIGKKIKTIDLDGKNNRAIIKVMGYK